MANDIIVERNLLIPRLTSLKDINYQLFCLIFDNIFNIDCSLFNPKTKSQEIEVISKLLSILSNDLVSISLDHIKPEDIVDKNLNTIYNLLEIIATFIKYIPKQFNKFENNANYKQNKNNFDSTKRKFNTKAIQTNFNENQINRDLRNDFYNKNASKYLNLLKTSSSSSYSAQSSLCESIPDLIQSTPESDYHLNACGDYKESHPKQEIKTQSKAIQTEVEPKSSPKTVSRKEITFDEFKKVKTDNFATELGHRLHEALKLKEMSEVIENKIKRYYGDVTVKSPVSNNLKSTLKSRNRRKHLIRSTKSPIIKRKVDLTKTKTPQKIIQISSLDDLIKAYPEISRNTIKSLREQERHQQRIVESLNKEVAINEAKVKSQLNSAIKTQNKRSQIIRNDIKNLESLAETKSAKLEKMKENATKRDSRIENARMHKTIESFHNQMMSKYKRLQAVEEKIVIEEFEKRHKTQQENIVQFRKRIKENHLMEIERQKKMLDAFETL